MKSLLSLCLLVLVASCHAGNGAGTLKNEASTPHITHHGMMVRPVRKPTAEPKDVRHLRADIGRWLEAWKAESFSSPTTGAKSPEFVESIVRDIIDKEVSCEDGRPFVYTSIFGGNLCFDYLVVRGLREYGGFACDIEIQNIDVLGLEKAEEAYIKRHADVKHIRHYKGVYDFIEEEKKRSPSDVVVSTQPAYDFAVSLKNNPTESQVLKYILDYEDDALDKKMQATAALWGKQLNTDSPHNSFSLQDLCIATGESRGKIAIGGETPWRCLRNVRYGLLTLDALSAEQFEEYTADRHMGWIPDLGRLFTRNPAANIREALGVVLQILSYFEATPDLVVPCFVDECLVYTPKAHRKADQYAKVIKYVSDAHRSSEGILSEEVNSAVNAMIMGGALPTFYKSRSGDVNIALYDVLATTATEKARAYILRGQSSEHELSGVERDIWQGLRMESAATMQALLKDTVKADYERHRFQLHGPPDLSSEEVEKLLPFVPPEHQAELSSV
eukprot:GILK01000784.1.p1 GENE.GILK01000784.1~~GILK01000784.1.p1  ORF type:complete len:511 (+),score=69.06 GILK01000784.1:30-1535(+)